MALQIRSGKRVGLSRLLSMPVLMLALVVQPIYGLVAHQTANATTASSTITEVSKTSNSITLQFEVNSEFGMACFKVASDAATSLPNSLHFNQRDFCLDNGTETIAFENVVEWIEVSEVLLDEFTWSRFSVVPTDTSRPTVELVAPATNMFDSMSTTLTVKATDDVALDRIVANFSKDGTLVRSTQLTVDGEATANHVINLWEYAELLPEGNYTVKYNALDKAGKLSLTHTYAFTVVDTTKPQTTLVQPTVHMSKDGAVNIRVDATDERGLDRIVANIYQDGVLYKSTSTMVNGAKTGTHAATVHLPDGAYTIRYNASDAAHNIATTREYEYVVDTAAPTFDLTVSKTRYVDTEDVVATVVARDGGSGVAGIEFVIYGFTADGQEIIRTCSKAPAQAQAELTRDCTKRLPVGTYVVTANAYDVAGNYIDDEGVLLGKTLEFEVVTATLPDNSGTEVPLPVGGDGSELPEESALVRLPARIAAVFGTAANAGTTSGAEAADDTADEKDTAVLGATDTRGGDITGEGEVLGDSDIRKEWSLVNAILAGVVVLMAIISLAGVRKGSASKARIFRMLTLIPALGAIVAVFLVEDFSAKLGWVNLWTILFAVIVVLQITFMVRANTAEEQ